jgi:hypothetical protein
VLQSLKSVVESGRQYNEESKLSQTRNPFWLSNSKCEIPSHTFKVLEIGRVGSVSKSSESSKYHETERIKWIVEDECLIQAN